MENPTPEDHIFDFNDDWEHIQTHSDDDLSVFPPSRHQDLTIVTTPLPLSTSHHSNQHPTSPSSSSSSSSSSSISSQASEPQSKGWILNLIFQSVIPKVSNLAAKLYSLFSLWKAEIFTMFCLTFIWVKSRQRRRVAEENATTMKKLLKEKERMIDTLLLQIAQMSDELSGRRVVPVYRVR